MSDNTVSMAVSMVLASLHAQDIALENATPEKLKAEIESAIKDLKVAMETVNG